MKLVFIRQQSEKPKSLPWNEIKRWLTQNEAINPKSCENNEESVKSSKWFPLQPFERSTSNGPSHAGQFTTWLDQNHLTTDTNSLQTEELLVHRDFLGGFGGFISEIVGEMSGRTCNHDVDHTFQAYWKSWTTNWTNPFETESLYILLEKTMKENLMGDGWKLSRLR